MDFTGFNTADETAQASTAFADLPLSSKHGKKNKKHKKGKKTMGKKQLRKELKKELEKALKKSSKKSSGKTIILPADNQSDKDYRIGFLESQLKCAKGLAQLSLAAKTGKLDEQLLQLCIGLCEEAEEG